MEKKPHLKIASSKAASSKNATSKTGSSKIPSIKTGSSKIPSIKTGSNKFSHKKPLSNCLEALQILQADVYTLYLKTQNYHWNVVGPNFHSLHVMFDEQYHELADAVDTIAERIRALDGVAPATFSEFLSLRTISEGNSALSASKMIQDLVQSHLTVCDLMHEICSLATDEEDDATLNLVGERLEVHEKTIWMLKAHLV